MADKSQKNMLPEKGDEEGGNQNADLTKEQKDDRGQETVKADAGFEKKQEREGRKSGNDSADGRLTQRLSGTSKENRQQQNPATPGGGGNSVAADAESNFPYISTTAEKAVDDRQQEAGSSDDGGNSVDADAEISDNVEELGLTFNDSLNISDTSSTTEKAVDDRQQEAGSSDGGGNSVAADAEGYPARWTPSIAICTSCTGYTHTDDGSTFVGPETLEEFEIGHWNFGDEENDVFSPVSEVLSDTDSSE